MVELLVRYRSKNNRGSCVGDQKHEIAAVGTGKVDYVNLLSKFNAICTVNDAILQSQQPQICPLSLRVAVHQPSLTIFSLFLIYRLIKVPSKLSFYFVLIPCSSLSKLPPSHIFFIFIPDPSIIQALIQKSEFSPLLGFATRLGHAPLTCILSGGQRCPDLNRKRANRPPQNQPRDLPGTNRFSQRPSSYHQRLL